MIVCIDLYTSDTSLIRMCHIHHVEELTYQTNKDVQKYFLPGLLFWSVHLRFYYRRHFSVLPYCLCPLFMG